MTIGPGSLINGKYRLGRQLGEGGMGAIFEARHEFLGTEVALKFLHPALSSRPHVVARFVQEARVSANIRSPHVVSVVDVDQSPEGLAFLVMELLHGEPLSGRLAREPVLPLPLVVSIALQVLLALETAHGLGVVHRDMKPENVFLTDAPGHVAANNQGLLVKILDFGIAKLRTLGEVRAQLTRPGVVMGTPEYMSPEQVFSADAVDARADLYALGAMCFEMLAGRRPVQGDDPRAIAAAVMGGQTPRLDQLVPHVPSSISDVVAISLSPKPNDRFTSATAMRQALVLAAREANVPIDAPQAALRSRTGLPVADASGQIVLGNAGLGVAPPAMLGPGNPAAMAAFDARSRDPLKVQSEPPPAVGSVPQLPVPPTNGAHVGDGAAQLGSGTLAAVPTPYTPAYGPQPPLEGNARADGLEYPGAEQPRAFDPGSTAMAPAQGGSGTDAGMMSPFATDRGFRPESMGDMGSTPLDSSVPQESERRSPPWIPIGVGVVGVIAIVVAVIWALQPSGTTAPAPPAAPAKSATDDDDTEQPKKKKPKPEVSAPPTVSAPATATVAPKPTTKPTTKPSVSVVPSASTSASVPKPQPSVTGLPPDIIPLPPLPPWPPQ